MADDATPDLLTTGFTKFFENKQRQAKAGLDTRRATEAQAHQAIEGRLSSTTDRKGYVQLNCRVPLDLKNQVIELRAARKAAGAKECDVGDIVVEALRAFLQKT